MTNSLGDTPAAARQRVRHGLRRARRATSLTQSDVANRLGWSLSKVQRIEIGEVAVSETDLRAALALLGVTAPDTVNALVDDARLARRERWSMPAEYRKYLSPGLRQLLQFEKVATEIRAYQTFAIPGVLQTPEMAEYIVETAQRDQVDAGDGNPAKDEERKVRFEARVLRRQQVIERLDGPAYYLLLDEAALERKVGGALLMAKQLEDLATVAARPNIFVRVIPKEDGLGAIMGAAGAFVLINLSDDTDDDVLYRELFHEDSLIHDPDKIHPYRSAFERLWKLSLSEDATQRRITATAAALRSELDHSNATTL